MLCACVSTPSAFLSVTAMGGWHKVLRVTPAQADIVCSSVQGGVQHCMG